MKFSFLGSLKARIVFLFFFLTAIVFTLNLTVAVNMFENEKRNDLQKVLTHATEESIDEYLPPDADEKTDISYLYDIPHNISILKDSDADSIRFIISKNMYIPTGKEVFGYSKTKNGLYLSCVSASAKIDAALSRYVENLLVKYTAYLVVMLAVSFVVLERLMRPLGALALRCRRYRDGDVFELSRQNYGSEICEVSDAFAALVERLGKYRKKEKELFKQAAHELKTPLAIMQARLDVYLSEDGYGKQEFVSEMNADIERLTKELKGVLFFESFDFEEPEELDIAAVLTKIFARMEILIKRFEVEVSVEGESFILSSPPRLFEKLLSALLENALTYAEHKSKIEIALDKTAKTICIKNKKGGEKYLFSSKIGQKILSRLSNEIGFIYKTTNDSDAYEVCLQF